ncbi:MAG: lipopolysaccharide biosynthesis protein [Treponema sp.]|jgi:uncharacterized protein involved in exopolysaccharide biosynthesis|nr:lipopolysaccharide biosynthesis protein [Treponema sp.]
MEQDLNKENPDDEISLIDLFAVLLQHKKMIITITIVGMIGALIFAVISIALPSDKSPLPNQFTPSALMLINDSSSSSGGLSSMLNSSGLSSLASLAGISADGASSNSDLAVYLVGTNTLLDSIVDKFDLLRRYKIVVAGKKPPKSPRADSRKKLAKKLVAEIDEDSGVLSISYSDTEPEFAQSVVNYCVSYLEQRFDAMGLDKNKIEKENLELNIANTFKEIQNLEDASQRLAFSISGGGIGMPSITLEINRLELELEAQKEVYKELKVQYELVKVAMVSEKPVFQVLELAEAPDKKSGPSRALLCIVVTFAAGFLAVFIAFARNAIANIKKDPEAMAKLHGIPLERPAAAAITGKSN